MSHLNSLVAFPIFFSLSLNLKGQFSFQSQESQCQKCSNYHTVALISHGIWVMLKTLQARLQQYVNHELSDVQAGFRNGRGTRDQISNILWIIEKQESYRRNISFCFIDYTKAFDCVDHNKLWKLLKEMGKPDHLTCLLRNLYAGQEATVRTGHGRLLGEISITTDVHMIPPLCQKVKN